jgi:hypothetical protein
MEGKGSTLVHIVVIALSLTAFGFAIAAERRRSTVSFHLFSEPLFSCVKLVVVSKRSILSSLFLGSRFSSGFRVLKLISHLLRKFLFFLSTFGTSFWY